MGSGGSKGLPIDRKISITGDIYSTETRNLLAVLEIGELNYKFFPAVAENEIAQDKVIALAKHSPIMEDLGRKIMGGQKELLLYSSFLDTRNAPKMNDKGKIIKKKKGTLPAKPLVPADVEHQQEMERLGDWFLMKFRPHCQHLFRQILFSLQYERVKGL